MVKRRRDSDLSQLGKRSWVKESLDGPEERDDSIVTGYSAVPLTGIEELKRIVGLNPDNLEMKDMLAFMLYSNERYDEAIDLYKDLAERNHNPGLQYLYLGNIYYQKGLMQLALVNWDKVREVDPISDAAAKAKDRARRVREGQSIKLEGKE